MRKHKHLISFSASYELALPYLQMKFGLAPRADQKWTSDFYLMTGTDKEGFRLNQQRKLQILHLAGRQKNQSLELAFEVEGSKIESPESFYIYSDDRSFGDSVFEFLQICTTALSYRGSIDNETLIGALKEKLPQLEWTTFETEIFGCAKDRLLFFRIENLAEGLQLRLHFTLQRSLIDPTLQKEIDSFADVESLTRHSVASVQVQNLEKANSYRSQFILDIPNLSEIDHLLKNQFKMS